MAGLISDQLLNQLRSVAYRQLVTPVTIERRTAVENDFGSEDSWSAVTTTTGWLVSKNVPVAKAGNGRIETVSAHELRLRMGTDCLAGDRVLIGGSYYLVQDLNAEVTITLLLKASLRRVSE